MIFGNLRQAQRAIRPALAQYTRIQTRWWRWLLCFIFTFFYGLIFGLYVNYYLIALLIPVFVLILAVIWVLPETDHPPVTALTWLTYAFLVVLLIWPDYLAISLPGLPWITAVRLVGVPLAAVMLICLSTSPSFRAEMQRTLLHFPATWRLIAAFAAISIFSVVVSSDAAASIDKLVVAAINWFLMFFAAVYVFRKPGTVMRLAYLLWGVAIVVSLIGLDESRHSAVPWAGHIPSFLAVEDDNVQRILSGASRAATGIYRVQSKFTTSLGLAEYYALTIPFIIHFAIFGRWFWLRLAALVTIPALFKMIILTDSRLGMVGFFLSMLIYLIIWAVWRWTRDRDSVFGPLIVSSYPAIFVGFIISTFYVGRLRALVWGTGAQQASTDSRKLQVAMGIPKVLKRPWGYGIGRSAEALQFYNGAGILTIDTYYLAVALEFGLLGFFVYYAIFVIGVLNAAKRLQSAITPEQMLIAPLLIALLNFLVIKSIFSQLENHALVFTMLGAVIALCWRIDRDHEARAVARVRAGAPGKAV